MGAATGSCAAASGGGRAVSLAATALADAGGASTTNAGWLEVSKANAGAGAAAGAAASGERAGGAAQPINPDEGGAPPTISADAAKTHG